MELYYYIHTIDNSELLAFTTSPVEVPINQYKRGVQLSETDLEKYKQYIKYIDCCTLSNDNTLHCDYIKILSKRLEQLNFDIAQATNNLRKLLVEAAALNKPIVVNEIAQTIKTLNEFLSSDFSSITDITQIENITCPELHINYNKYYESKIYEI